MDEFLKSLKTKERELITALEKSPLFIQLESLRNTILAFENNGINLNGNGITNQHSEDISEEYNASEFTWKEKVLFVIRKYGEASVAEIIAAIGKLESNHTKAWLDKRIGVTVSQLKKDGKLGVKTVNKKNKYYLV